MLSSRPHDFYDTLLDTFEEIRRDVVHKHTVTRNAVPPIFREFNIINGYRPVGKRLLFYIRSFFMLHNESMNVWTHFFGAFIIAREAFRFYDDFHMRATFDSLLILVFAACSFTLHLASSTAHLVHNHSETTHCTAFYFDNAAVGLAAGSVTLIHFCYTSLPDHYEACKGWFLETVVIGPLILSTTMSYALAKYRRSYNWRTSVLMFGPTGLLFLWSCSPFLYKCYRYFLCGQTDIDFQLFYFFGSAVFMVAVAFYTSSFPESHFPGVVDIFGHSHQIFHLLVTLSHLMLIWAVRQDVEASHPMLASKRKFPYSPENVAFAFLLTGMIDVIVLVVLRLKYGRLSSESHVVKREDEQ